MSGITFDEFDPTECGGRPKVMPGGYHLQVVKVDPDTKNGMAVAFEVLRGTTPHQVGNIHNENFSNDIKKVFQKKKAALALATGIITMEMAKKAKDAGQELIPDWHAMQGKQLCANLVESEDGKWTNINYDEMWQLDDKRSWHIPLSATMLKAGGIVLPAERPIDGIQPGAKEGGKKTAKQAATAIDDSVLKGI